MFSTMFLISQLSHFQQIDRVLINFSHDIFDTV